MSRNTNVRCIRVSEEMDELINQQIGDTYTAKFTNLVTRCVWELPAKEAELKRLDELIKKKQNALAEADSRYARMLNHLRQLEPKLEALEYAVADAITDWKVDV